MRIERLDHVNIRTPLFEETLTFYEAALGLKRGPAGSATGRRQNMWLYTEGGAPVIHVNGPAEGETVADAGQQSRLHHVAFFCTGLAAARERLAALGVATQEMRIAARSLLQINVTDPNGVLVELQFDEAAEG